jgi:peptidoglycan/xylan/chitin deacetylase (PgdA/CDA1 family)
MMNIPILTYHAVEREEGEHDRLPPNKALYLIKRDLFEAQMKYLAEQGVRTLLVDDLLAMKNDNRNGPPGNSVCLTFDDGNASDYSIVYPILKRHGLNATFFVVTDCIGLPSCVSWDQLREMSHSGMSIQSHTHTHPFLSQCTDAKVREEFAVSRAMLEEHLLKTVRILAVPGGDWGERFRTIVEACGYEAVCTSRPGINQSPVDLYSLERLSIRRADSVQKFISLITLDPRILFTHTLYNRSLNVARRLLGIDQYNAVRAWLLRRRRL